MANTIDVAFIKQFESEVHMAYQRMGSKLRNTVRMASQVTGSTVRFQKLVQALPLLNQETVMSPLWNLHIQLWKQQWLTSMPQNTLTS